MGEYPTHTDSGFPTTVYICGISFRVFEHPLGDDCGSSNATERTISIDSAQPYSVKVETFYHEITHMILALQGHDKWLGEKFEETVAQGIGFGLAQFVTHNRCLPMMTRQSLDEIANERKESEE